MIDRLKIRNAGQLSMKLNEGKETVSKQQDKRSRDGFVFVILEVFTVKCIQLGC